MEPKNDRQPGSQKGNHQDPLKQEITSDQNALNESAHVEAEKDMDNDVEFSAHSPNDDLDEGETARLGEEIPEIF